MELALILTVAALSSFTQAVTGFGFAIVGVPLLLIVLGPQEAVVVITVLSVPLTIGAAVRERRQVHWRPVLMLSAAAVLGLPLGIFALRALDPRWLTLVIGIVVIGAAALLAVRGRAGGRGGHRNRPAETPGGYDETPPRYDEAPSRAGGVLPISGAGIVSGALLGSTGMNGPPVVALFQALRMRPRPFRASLQVTFAIQDVLAVAGFALAGLISTRTLLVTALSLPLLAGGWWLGNHVFARLGDRLFRGLVLAMLFTTGMLAVVQSLDA